MGDKNVSVEAAEVESNGRLEVDVDGARIVVFARNGEFVAYHDVCPHQGGPVCSKGELFRFYTARVAEDGKVENYFEEGGEKVIACPWHGWEFDLDSGRCLADKTYGLRRAKVAKDGDKLIISA